MDFEGSPHIEQIEEGTLVAAHGDLEEVADEGAVGRRHSGPPALRDLEQPARRQRPRGLPHSEPAHAERLRELSLRRQRLSGLERAEDQALELLDHRADDGRAVDRLEFVQRLISHADTYFRSDYG